MKNLKIENVLLISSVKIIPFIFRYIHNFYKYKYNYHYHYQHQYKYIKLTLLKLTHVHFLSNHKDCTNCPST